MFIFDIKINNVEVIGKVKVYLDKMSGVKFPMEAKLNKP